MHVVFILGIYIKKRSIHKKDSFLVLDKATWSEVGFK